MTAGSAVIDYVSWSKLLHLSKTLSPYILKEDSLIRYPSGPNPYNFKDINIKTWESTNYNVESYHQKLSSIEILRSVIILK